MHQRAKSPAASFAQEQFPKFPWECPAWMSVIREAGCLKSECVGRAQKLRYSCEWSTNKGGTAIFGAPVIKAGVFL